MEILIIIRYPNYRRSVLSELGFWRSYCGDDQFTTSLYRYEMFIIGISNSDLHEHLIRVSTIIKDLLNPFKGTEPTL